MYQRDSGNIFGKLYFKIFFIRDFHSTYRSHIFYLLRVRIRLRVWDLDVIFFLRIL